MKKAQGISMNVIIVAAIALLVLVVLIAIFSGRMGIFGKGLNEQDTKIGESCIAQGGICYADDAPPSGEGWMTITGTCADGMTCYKRS